MKTLEKVALFWDVDHATLDEEQHADFIIRRVLARGDIDDVRWAFSRYGNERVAAAARTARDFDARTAHFWKTHFESAYAS
ncbi:MAG: hypothetical protein AAB605_02465 [Patescibacteria group bacterium]